MRLLYGSSSAIDAALVAALWLGSPVRARADILVVSSDVTSIKAGQQMADSERVEVPAGGKVRVLLPSGKTQLITGPANGTVSAIAGTGPTVDGIWAKARDLLATGGADSSRPGATRGAAAAEAAFAWTTVPTTASGSVCAVKGAPLALSRALGGAAIAATLIDTTATAKASVTWAAASLLADWPADMAPTSGAVYQLVAPGQRPVLLTMHLIDSSETQDDGALASLLQNGCKTQARAWLGR